MKELQKNGVSFHRSRGCIRLMPKRGPAALFNPGLEWDRMMCPQLPVGNKPLEAIIIAWLISGGIQSLV